MLQMGDNFVKIDFALSKKGVWAKRSEFAWEQIIFF